MDPDTKQQILEVANLSVSFGQEKVIDDINFSLFAGKCLGIVGESGSGKTVCTRSILRLNRGANTQGKIIYNGQDILQLAEKDLLKIRGKNIAMIFQDPVSGLNPVLTIGEQLKEVIKLHQKTSNSDANRVATNLLKKMKISDPERRMNEYPHQQSGGINQRVMIAEALACQPKILIADEPTSSLDTINQRIVLSILGELKQQSNMSLIFVTHNINLAKLFSDDIAIMKNGHLVEHGNAEQVLNNPKEDYTKELINSSI